MTRKEAAWVEDVLTGALFGETAGVAQQLEGLLEAGGVLRSSIRGLDVGDEGAHLPLGLAGGWGEQALVALVQRTGAHRVGHGQNGDLQEEEEKERHYIQHDEGGVTSAATNLVVLVDGVEDDQS